MIKNVIIKSEQSNNKIKSDYDENANSLMFTRANTRKDIDDDVDTFIE